MRRGGIAAVSANGVLGDARAADANKGRTLLDDATRALVDFVTAWTHEVTTPRSRCRDGRPATGIDDRRRPPAGFLVRLAGGALVRDGMRLLAGGVPFRLIRLNDAGAAIAAPWINGGGPIGEALGARTLARRLLDCGLLDAVPPPIAGDAWRANVAVVVPVCDRPALLDRCLAALGSCRVEVVVVDDGSRDHTRVTAIAERARGPPRPPQDQPRAERRPQHRPRGHLDAVGGVRRLRCRHRAR